MFPLELPGQPWYWLAMRTVLRLLLCLPLLLPSSAAAAWSLRECLLYLASAAYRQTVAQAKKHEQLFAQTTVETRECPKLDIVEPALLIAKASEFDSTGMRIRGLAYRVELLNRSQELITQQAAVAVGYGTWDSPGNPYPGQAVKRMLEELKRTNDPRLEQVAEIHIFVGRRAGRENEGRSRRLAATVFEQASAFGIRPLVRLEVAEAGHSRDADARGFLAELTPLVLTPVSRYEPATFHLNVSDADGLEKDQHGKLLKPFPLPNGLRADNPMPPRQKGMETIPVELGGKPVYAIKSSQGIAFGSHWTRPVINLTTYLLSPEKPRQ